MKTRYRNNQNEVINSNKVLYFSQRFPALTLSILILFIFSCIGTIIGGFEGFIFYSLFIGVPLIFGWGLVFLFRYISSPYITPLQKKDTLPYEITINNNTLQTHNYISANAIKDIFQKYLFHKKLNLKNILAIILSGAGVYLIIIWCLIVINQLDLFIHMLFSIPIYYSIMLYPHEYIKFLKKRDEIEIIVLKYNFNSYARVGDTLYFF